MTGHDFNGRRIIIVGACQPPGPDCAQALAQAGARVVALDVDAAGLQRLSHRCSARIEPLALRGDIADAVLKIGEIWGKAPLHGLLNLMPLQHPRDINGQVRMITVLTRAFARGLVAGSGALVTVAGLPRDRLNGLALAMGPALAEVQRATASELGPHGVRVNTVLVPQRQAERAQAPALALLCKDARDVTGHTLRLSAAGTGREVD